MPDPNKEKANRDLESILNSIVENSTDQIFLLDRNYKYLIVNKALANVIGKPQKEIIGKTISDTYPSGTAVRFRNNVDKVFISGKSFFIEERMAAQGKILDISTSLNPVIDNSGNLIAVAGIVRDITERKELQKQLREKERLAAIGTTAGMVGHDIRNPLQAILGDIFLIEQEIKTNPKCGSKDIEEYVENISSNIAYINKIVSDLQDYTKEIKPTLTNVKLKNIISNILGDYKVPSNIAFHSEVDSQITFWTDATYLKRILGNLIMNSIQAMPQGGKLTIKASKSENFIEITVEDTGMGIKEEDKSQLFKPLFTTKAKGQGLGLAVVKRLVEALGGTINFDSEIGKGTVFMINLPIKSSI